MKVTTYYGVHWSGELAFLDQEVIDQKTGRVRSSGNNVFGLPTRSPFEVRPLKRGLRCNHRIQTLVTNPDPSHRAKFVELVGKDELTRAMLPIPKPEGFGGYWLPRPDDVPDLNAKLALLAQMSWPVAPIRHEAWAVDEHKMLDELTVSNVQPLVLSGVEPKHTEMVYRLGQALPSQPRVLVVIANRDVPVQPGYRKIATRIGEYDFETLALLPWQQLGAVVLRFYMRSELDWLPDRQDLRRKAEEFLKNHPELRGRKRD